MNVTVEPVETKAVDPNGAATNARAGGTDPSSAVARPTPLIQPLHFALAEYKVNRWFSVAPPGVRAADLEGDAPWALVASDLSRFDSVRVACDTEVADLIVVDVGPGYARCSLTCVTPLPVRRSLDQSATPPGYEVVQGGPSWQDSWRVVRVADGVTLNQPGQHYSREDAAAYLRNHPAVRGDVNPSRFGIPNRT